jgi:recombination protein RecA
LDLAVNLNIVNKSGAWFSYGENRIGQGRDNAREFLKKDPKLLAEIEGKVRAEVGLVKEEPASEKPAAKEGASSKGK